MCAKIILFILLTCFLGVQNGFAQVREDGRYALDSIPQKGLLLNTFRWKFQSGDNAQWAKMDFDDATWQNVNPQLWIDSLNGKFDKVAWLRIHLDIDSSLFHQAIALNISQRGASEIYLNGKLIRKIGSVSENTDEQIKYNPTNEPIMVQFDNQSEQVIAVRYSNTNGLELYKYFGRYARTLGFKMTLISAENALREIVLRFERIVIMLTVMLGIMLALGALHLVIYAFYKKQKANLNYGLFCIIMFLGYCLDYLSMQSHSSELVIYYNIANFLLNLFVVFPVLNLIYNLFSVKKAFYYNYLYLVFFLVGFLFFINSKYASYIVSIFFVLIVGESLRAIVKGYLDNKGNTRIVALGAVLTILFFLIYGNISVTFGLQPFFSFEMNVIIQYASILSIVIAMSIFLAQDFATMNSRLEEKLLEVQELSEKTIAQERITQQILASQNEQLEHQVKQRTFEIQDKNDELSQQNEEIMAQRNAIEVQNEKLGHTFQQITDSVRYAQRIQRAILGDADEIVSNFADAFIFFKPRDIVSGDFYWFASLENANQGVAKFKHENSKSSFEHCCTMKLMIAADCTGHGVPGAFMTIMGNDFLDDIIISQGISRPDKILYALDNKITTALQRGSKNAFDKIQDGMDIAVIALDEINHKLYYAGAKNPLWYVRNGEIHQIAASKFPIGSTQYKTEKVYECHEIDTQVGDIFYIFTDGYQDQFGYENKQKYMKKRFREFLLSISHLDLTEQKAKLEQEMEAWSPQNSGNQTDDMLVIGIKI